MHINILSMLVKNTLFIALPVFIIALIIAEPKDEEANSANSSVVAQSSNDKASAKPQIQVEPKQENITQSVEKIAETQTAMPTEKPIEPQTATPPTETQAQIQGESVDYEQKFGKRIYLATKDDFVNMRKAPSGEIITQIYKKDFADIMVFSFDTNSNEKWLKVVYFPPNVKDEQNAISGYIHISQIDKSKLN